MTVAGRALKQAPGQGTGPAECRCSPRICRPCPLRRRTHFDGLLDFDRDVLPPNLLLGVPWTDSGEPDIIWHSMSEVTVILQAIGRGESHASEELLPLGYDELRPAR